MAFAGLEIRCVDQAGLEYSAVLPPECLNAGITGMLRGAQHTALTSVWCH